MECQWNTGRSLWITLGVHVRYKSPPVDGARRASVVMFTERLGTRKVTAKVPRSSRAELKVDCELRTSGHTEYGTTCLSRMDGISVVMRWVYAAENYPGRRFVRCKQGIGCWNMQTVGAWLSDVFTGRFKYYSWVSLAKCASFVILCCGSVGAP